MTKKIKNKKSTEQKNEDIDYIYKSNMKILRDKKEFLISGAIFKNLKHYKILITENGIFYEAEGYKKSISSEKVQELIMEVSKVQYEDNQKSWQLQELEKFEEYLNKLLEDF